MFYLPLFQPTQIGLIFLHQQILQSYLRAIYQSKLGAIIFKLTRRDMSEQCFSFTQTEHSQEQTCGSVSPQSISIQQPVYSISSFDLNSATKLEETSISPFLARSAEDIRKSYLSKLQQKGFLPQGSRQKCYHLIVLDWDDTLFCSSHLSQLQVELPSQLPPSLVGKVKQLDLCSSKFLSSCIQLANTIIVTNSVQGWVEFCGRWFLPNTMKLINQFKVPIISARTKYQQRFPCEPRLWKLEAFKDLVSTLSVKTIALNLVSIGDSLHEISAADQSTLAFERRFIKTIKLKESPRVEQILKQLTTIQMKLRQIVGQPKSISIKLEKK